MVRPLQKPLVLNSRVISPKLDKDVEFIEAKNDVLIEMLYSTMLYMLNHSDEMDQVLKSVMED